MLPITGTFLDEISHDIPHQNWGPREWRMDFEKMKAIEIDTVIMIRCGYKKWLTYPSQVLSGMGCFVPSFDLVQLFLNLSEEFGMDFYFGLFDSGQFWSDPRSFNREIEINLKVIDEVWDRYGKHPAFKGWYVCQEVSRKVIGAIDLYCTLGRHCKQISGGLPTLISPYIDGTKAILSSQASLTKQEKITLAQHETEWDEILDAISGHIDMVAFQDGHVPLEQLSDYLLINKSLMDKYRIVCWSNAESFDRDMPIKFLPIKWEKLLIKLQAAQAAGIEKAITFEFSHFMSPNSAYIQAHHLYNRYNETLFNGR